LYIFLAVWNSCLLCLHITSNHGRFTDLFDCVGRTVPKEFVAVLSKRSQIKLTIKLIFSISTSLLVFWRLFNSSTIKFISVNLSASITRFNEIVNVSFFAFEKLPVLEIKIQWLYVWFYRHFTFLFLWVVCFARGPIMLLSRSWNQI
jgi:hypothetical protein